MSDPTKPRRPTSLGGKSPSGRDQAGGQAAAPIRPVNDPGQEMPSDLAALAKAAGLTTEQEPEVSRETVPPATAAAVQRAASPLASGLAGQPANKGEPKQNARPVGMQISVASMLRTAPKTPEQDTHNPGWRYPRYMYNVVRLLAFQLKADQQKVAEELLYAAMMDVEPGGCLAGVPRETIKALLTASWDEAARALGANGAY